MASVSAFGDRVKRTRADCDARQINRAVCVTPNCGWQYEDEHGHLAKARAEAHRYAARHTVELRLDVLDLFVERLVPRAEVGS